MKRTVIMLSMLLAGMGNAMQAKDVKGTVVYRSDGQPVVGAEVRVKGTEITTLTDIDGRFTLADVPDDARKIQVYSIGMQARTATIPPAGDITVQMKREERIVTPFVKAGMTASLPYGDDVYGGDGLQIGYTAGIGASFALSHFVSLAPSVNLTQKKGKWTMDDAHGKKTYKTDPLYLTIPVLLELKAWTKNSNKVVTNVGPYVSVGLDGTYDIITKKGTKEKSGDLFGGDGAVYKKVEAGMQLGVGAVIRHLYFGVNLQLGLTPLLEASGPDESSPNVKNFSADLSVGYCF